MDKRLRESFNLQFTKEKYEAYCNEITIKGNHQLDFRIAETPVFIPKKIINEMLQTGEYLIDCILDSNFKTLTEKSIPKQFHIPQEGDHPSFIVVDFGICKNEKNEIIPQLIELQGFPSLFGFQILSDEITKKYANVPDTFDSFLNDYQREQYISLLKEIIIGESNPAEVILLDIYPEKQKTRIDFYCIEKWLGIKTVCVSQLKADGQELYYMNHEKKIPVKKIFNRLVFDELKQYDIASLIDFTMDYEVEWISHPNWFYRISKFMIPFLEHPNVPVAYFLNELKTPVDLNEFVLKPLFSFAGMGVIIDVTQTDLDNIPDPENWILQKKVDYAPIIDTIDDPAKAEIRLFYFWKKGWERPIPIHNLARLSKGKMIGTRYNENKTWVGGTIAYFEK